jgi:HD superfamily phosphohydrolase
VKQAEQRIDSATFISSDVRYTKGLSSKGSNRKKIILRYPIHGFIRLDHYDFIQDIVDSAPLQRLRRISQLGMSVMVYPTAIHNRFSHTLGAMHTFLLLWDQLHPKNARNAEVEYLRQLGTAAILLHDVGHGSFSHTSEEFFGFKHEDLAKDVILKSEIASILENYRLDPKEVINILERTVAVRFTPQNFVYP